MDNVSTSQTNVQTNTCPISKGLNGGNNMSESTCSSGSIYYGGEIHDKSVHELCNKRSESSIPSKERKWIYPSERQFYKSTIAKGHRVDTNLIPTMVKIHNAVNEKAWEMVMEFESLHESECETPILGHFVGKQNELSLKARFNRLLGYKLPYDRHDWTIDRCGKQIRYIIDFYEGKPRHSSDIAMYIDARPAVTFGGVIDRLRIWMRSKRKR